MASPQFLLGQIETIINTPVQKSVSTSVGDTVVIIGCALVLGAILFGAAYYYRKRRPAHHRHQYPAPPEAPTENAQPSHSHRRRRRRHRKASHPDKRPRNPTLNETGGLPPMRAETDE